MSTVLALDQSAEKHTAENVREHIDSLIQEYKLSSKVVASRGSQMVSVGCAAHSLQIIVNKAIVEVNANNVLAKARKTVGHVKHFAANYREFREIMKVKGEKDW